MDADGGRAANVARNPVNQAALLKLLICHVMIIFVDAIEGMKDSLNVRRVPGRM